MFCLSIFYENELAGGIKKLFNLKIVKIFMKKESIRIIGGIIGVVLFVILNYLDLNLAYRFFNSFSYGLGQDKFITVGFISLGLSLLFWILIGVLIGFLIDKIKK